MPDNTKIMVLIADDEPSMRALVASHLKRRGYRVIEASDGDEAWELAHEHLPDIVVLDVMMPGMSGWEVCRKIREAVSLAHTGVVMLTGIGENLNEMTSPLYGADAYVDKPFEFSVLDSKITETVTRRAAGRLGRGDNGAAQAKPKAVPPPLKRPAKAAAPKEEPKPAAKAAAPKKAASKKAAPKKAAPKKSAKRAAPKKAAAKKAAPKKAAPKKSAKKAAPKKAAAKKTKKAAKPAAKKAKAKKAAPKKAAPKKAARRGSGASAHA